MTQGEFILALNALLPDCKPDAAWLWVSFVVKNLDHEQFAHFIPTKDCASAVGSWLDTTYAGLYEVRQKYGPKTATEVADLSCQGCALYPGEMMRAAGILNDGRNAGHIRKMIMDGQIEAEPPFFFNLPEGAALAPLNAEIAVAQSGIPGSPDQGRVEPGFLLADGTVLLESERDSFGRYRSDAGMNTGRLYAPVREKDGRIKAFQEVKVVTAQERETAFLNMDNGAAIYRLIPPEQADLDRYLPVAQLQKNGEGPLMGNYSLVHVTPIASCATADSILALYRNDLALVPGDIVAIKQMDGVMCWYVDQLAYSKLPGLLENHLRAVELSAEQNCNQIDGIINNEAPKPSLRETLRQYQEEAKKSQNGDIPPGPNRNPER